MANTIDSSLLLSNFQQKQRKTGSDILGKDDFLKILMVQLQNQDPSNPMKDQEFIAQMATFSTLEQITNMNTSIQQLAISQQQSYLMSFTELIGKDIKWHKIEGPEDPEAEPEIQEGTGKVVSVIFKEGTVNLTLEDGTILEPGNISEVHSASGDIVESE